MKPTVVGCSGSFPGPDSAASCYLVEAPYEGRTFRLLLDLGSGALGPLQKYVELDQVDAVALSHLHPDHCLDLCGFYVVRKYHPSGALPRLPRLWPGRRRRANGAGLRHPRPRRDVGGVRFPGVSRRHVPAPAVRDLRLKGPSSGSRPTDCG